MYLHIYIYIDVCMYTYMYVYIYIYIYLFICLFIYLSSALALQNPPNPRSPIDDGKWRMATVDRAGGAVCTVELCHPSRPDLMASSSPGGLF